MIMKQNSSNVGIWYRYGYFSLCRRNCDITSSNKFCSM